MKSIPREHSVDLCRSERLTLTAADYDAEMRFIHRYLDARGHRDGIMLSVASGKPTISEEIEK